MAPVPFRFTWLTVAPPAVGTTAMVLAAPEASFSVPSLMVVAPV